MPKYWDKTITIYNRYEDTITGQITWYRHTLSNCFVKRTNINVQIGNEHIQTDDNIVRIPYQANYLSPYDWAASADKSAVITLQTGDIIIAGSVDDVINEYISGQRSTDVIAKYKALGVFKIKSVNENTSLPNRHYYVRGE